MCELDLSRSPFNAKDQSCTSNKTQFPVCSPHVLRQACRDFLELAETHSRRWQRALQYEREQRTHLEETIEQLAKQHNSLERAWREAPALASTTPSAPAASKGESALYSSVPWASACSSLYWESPKHIPHAASSLSSCVRSFCIIANEEMVITLIKDFRSVNPFSRVYFALSTCKQLLKNIRWHDTRCSDQILPGKKTHWFIFIILCEAASSREMIV